MMSAQSCPFLAAVAQEAGSAEIPVPAFAPSQRQWHATVDDDGGDACSY
jgi:hypothetical protein